MDTTTIGRTGVRVSRLGLGTAPIGNLYRAVDDATARTAVNAAWDAGMRYFDTAPHYGLGLAEARLGHALSSRPRAEFTVSTKVGRLLVPNPAPAGSDVSKGGFDVPDVLARRLDYTADGVRRSLDESLARLGLDRVDIVYVHDPEDNMDVAIGQAVPALIKLREEGVVGAVGAGMNFVAPLRRFIAETDVDVVMVAGRWTLLDRSALPLLDEAAARGVAVVAAAPFNSGLLALREPAADATFDYTAVPPDVLTRARTLAQAARGAGTTLPRAALQFPLRHHAVAAVVVGAADAEEVRTNAAAFADPVSESVWSVLKELEEPATG